MPHMYTRILTDICFLHSVQGISDVLNLYNSTAVVNQQEGDEATAFSQNSHTHAHLS